MPPKPSLKPHLKLKPLQLSQSPNPAAKKSQALETQNIIILVILIIIFLITISIYFIGDFSKYQENQSLVQNNTVTRIIDGDTFQLSSQEIVRLLCIDTPELGNAGSEEAKQFLEDLILNKEVRLEKDISNTDKYNRLLRYAYINNNTNNQEIFINKELFNQGFAAIFKVEPDIKRCDEIKK